MVFIELCVLKLEDDCFPLLEVLGLLMNPSCRYDLFDFALGKPYKKFLSIDFTNQTIVESVIYN